MWCLVYFGLLKGNGGLGFRIVKQLTVTTKQHMQHKKKILVFIDWFLPGYKAGGPVRSMANMVAYLKDEFDFYIVTRNTDYTETTPYAGITPNQWTDFSSNVKVYYTSTDQQNKKSYKRIIQAEHFEIIYINGIYSWKFSILPLLAAKKFTGKKIVASRGMLAQSAIDVKSGKKQLFLKAIKFVNLYKNVFFHATNEKEEKDILNAIGQETKVLIADNLPKSDLPSFKHLSKEKGKLKLVSLARISPEKNTLFALEKLSELKPEKDFQLELDLYGQIYNEDYWKECQQLISKLPPQIKVTYKGTVDADEVGETIQQYHILFLPSRGENFGHVILESFMSGRPVLISDQTPWRNLEKEKCGWDLPLGSEISIWIKTIEKLINLEQNEFDSLCKGARLKAENFIQNPELLNSYKALFN